MNKKGISAVVTTVLIILLSIIAVVILWSALKGPIQDAAENTGNAISCTEITLEVPSCVIVDTGEKKVDVTVKRSGGAGDIFVLATVSDASNSASGNSTLGPLDTRVIQVNGTLLTGTRTVQVAAKLDSGDLCPPTTATCA